jgi:hypothetical protein
MAVIFSTDFTGTAGHDISTVGFVQSEHPDQSMPIVLSTVGTARSGSGDSGLSGTYLVPTAAASAEYDVEAVILAKDWSPESYPSIQARAAVNDQVCYGVYLNFGSEVWVLFRRATNGSDTTLGTYNDSFGLDTPRTVKLEIRDATKKVYINGVERISSSDNTLTRAGLAGLGTANWGGDAAGQHFDSFIVTDLDTGGGEAVRPVATTSAGGWSAVGAGSLHAATADESDSTYAESPSLSAGQSAVMTLELDDFSSDPASGQNIAGIRYAKGSGSDPINLLLEVLDTNGSTVLASNSWTGITATITNASVQWNANLGVGPYFLRVTASVPS